MKAQNNFAITGFIASDAKVTDFGKAQKVRFGIRVTTVQKDKDGNERKETAIINAETIVKKDDTAKMELLKKGSFVTTRGFFKPEDWTDKDGKKHYDIKMAVTGIEKFSKDDK